MSVVLIKVFNYTTHVARIRDVTLKNATWGQDRASWDAQYTGLFEKLIISSNAQVRSSVVPVQTGLSFSFNCRLDYKDPSTELWLGSASFLVGGTPAATGSAWTPYTSALSDGTRLVAKASELGWHGGDYVVSFLILEARRKSLSRLARALRRFGT